MTPELSRTPVGALTVAQLLQVIADAGGVVAPPPPPPPPSRPEDDRMLKPRQAAKRLGAHLNTLRRWRQEEGLPYIEVAPQVYRYRVDDIDAWLRARGRSAPPHCTDEREAEMAAR